MGTERKKRHEGKSAADPSPAAGIQGQVPMVWAGSARTECGQTSNLRDRWLMGMEGLFLDPKKDARTEWEYLCICLQERELLWKLGSASSSPTCFSWENS